MEGWLVFALTIVYIGWMPPKEKREGMRSVEQAGKQAKASSKAVEPIGYASLKLAQRRVRAQISHNC